MIFFRQIARFNSRLQSFNKFFNCLFSDGGPPRERPRLQLAKRTAPAEGAAPASSGPSPFGAAKPVNTAAKEREIEEKLAKDKPQTARNTREQRSRTTSERSDDSRENNRQKDAGEEKSDRPAPPASKSNPFGNAKPVDRSERPERSADDSRENNRENNRQIDEEPKSDRPPPPAAKSNPFGNARPIDSTKREREIEEKLRKTDISEDKPRSNQQKSQHTDEKTTTNSNEKSGGDEPKKVRSPPPPKEIEEPPVSYSTNLFMTSKNETTNSTIHEFKVLHKDQRAF